MQTRSSSEIITIQYLRGIAAVLVVLHHALDQFPAFGAVFGNFSAGQAGVDIFFVISGFVMTYTEGVHHYTRGEFLIRRAIRIIPIYWTLTLLTAVLLLLGQALTRHSQFSIPHLLGSLLFVPMYNPGASSQITPMLKLGWTLNYEVFFYLAFALFIAWRRPARIAALALVFVTFVLLAPHVPRSDAPLIFWGNAIVFEFLAGCILADLFLRGAFARLPRPFLVVLGAAGIVLLTTTGFVEFGVHRALSSGLPAAMIVVAAVGLEQQRPLTRRSRALHFIGDASYSIYLAHMYAVVCMRLAWTKLHLPQAGASTALLFVLLCLTGGTALGSLTYVWAERPLMRLARSLPMVDQRLKAFRRGTAG